MNELQLIGAVLSRFINGLPGVSPAFDATTVKAFSQTVRQVFGHVEAKYSAANNNTATLDAVVVSPHLPNQSPNPVTKLTASPLQTLGALHVIPLPIDTRIVVPAIFDEETCLITELPTYITIPTSLAGNPINPPTVPKIPGLERLPGFQPILRALIPAIGNIYNL